MEEKERAHHDAWKKAAGPLSQRFHELGNKNPLAHMRPDNFSRGVKRHLGQCRASLRAAIHEGE
eukprot:61739-Amphidinium_carterae.1